MPKPHKLTNVHSRHAKGCFVHSMFQTDMFFTKHIPDMLKL
jgi:hypothetical protein